MLVSGDLLQGRYRIVSPIKSGGMGAVYEALDTRLNSRVALKETLFTDDVLRRQFEREAQLLARLRHPSLVRVTDHFTDGQGQFLVMELVDGHDLAEIQSQHGGALSIDRITPWMVRLFDVLRYLHTRQPAVIHRDLKPANIKVTADGNVVLLDFGLAKGSMGTGTSVVPSMYGFTPSFAPPEQVLGRGTDARSDLYSLAATMYALLTGVAPRDALERSAALVSGSDDTIRSPREMSPDIPPALDLLIMRAMSLRPDDRPASASEMETAFTRAIEIVQTAVVPPPAPATHLTTDSPPTAAPLNQYQPTEAQPKGSRARAPELPTSDRPALRFQRTAVVVAGGVIAAAVVGAGLMAIGVFDPPVAVPTPPAVTDSSAIEPPPPPPPPPPSPSPQPTRKKRASSGLSQIFGFPLPANTQGADSGAVAAPPATGPVRVGGTIRPPTLTKHVPPVYPPLAIAAKISGNVIVEAIIGKDGKIRSAKIVSPPQVFLDDAALAAVRQWEYTPTLLEGVPVEVILNVTVKFNLTELEPSANLFEVEAYRPMPPAKPRNVITERFIFVGSAADKEPTFR